MVWDGTVALSDEGQKNRFYHHMQLWVYYKIFYHFMYLLLLITVIILKEYVSINLKKFKHLNIFFIITEEY